MKSHLAAHPSPLAPAVLERLRELASEGAFGGFSVEEHAGGYDRYYEDG
ncbi:hypothetical protein [Kitasatospora sp. NPDC056184]